MEGEENTKKRNVRPKEVSRLPLITLITLLGIILALFAVGWEYITDDVKGSEEVTDIVPGSASFRQGDLKVGDLILRVAQGAAEPVSDL